MSVSDVTNATQGLYTQSPLATPSDTTKTVSHDKTGQDSSAPSAATTAAISTESASVENSDGTYGPNHTLFPPGYVEPQPSYGVNLKV